MNDKERLGPWWGDYEIEVEEAAKWDIGPLSLWLGRGASEWRLVHQWDAESEAIDWRFMPSASLPEDEVGAERFALSDTGSRVRLRPLPADRSVVARPRSEFQVLPGQQVRIFLSSPMWVEIGVGSAPTVVADLPTKKLSDTWFGATTRDGELCYSLKTSAITDLAEMANAAYRLLTPVLIDNRAGDALAVERLSLPVPYLSVYGTEAGQAWTEEVRMVRTEDGGLAELDLGEGPPAEAAGADRLAEPRAIAAKGQLFRAFGSLLGLDL